MVPEHGAKAPRGEHQHPRRLLGDRGRRARAAEHERDLTQEVARAQLRQRAAVALDAHSSRHQHEELAADASLARQLLAGVDVDVLGQHRQRAQLALRELAEERHAAEELDLGIATRHGRTIIPKPRRAPRAARGPAPAAAPP
jgi:hypothetical protein